MSAVRSGKLQLGLLAIVLAASMPPTASRAYTPEEQQACQDDAFRLCGPDIPDVDRVKVCMVRRKAELSPGCAVYFRSDPPPAQAAATGRPMSIKPETAKKPAAAKAPKPKKPAKPDAT
jgi:hypothetical protein